MAALENQMQSMLPSADDNIRPEDYPQYKPDDFTGRSFAADSFQETKDRFMDAGKIDVDPDDPAIFTAYKRAVDYLKDTGLAGLGLADTAFKYAVGSVAQVMPTEQLEKRMARDLYSMPEAFGGAAGAKSITQLDDAADAFLEGSRQVAQKLKTEYDPTMVRSFVGATPPTYQEREVPLSSPSLSKNLMGTETYPNTARLLQQELGDNFTAIPDEVLDIYNMGLLIFREPIVEFAETLDIPKKGLLGSEFLNRVKKNPSIPETSLQESVIEPSKRYTKEELLRALGVQATNRYGATTKGTFRSVANISPARIKQFERYQRQGRDAGFVGGTEIDYFDIPLDVTIGYPGKKFKAHSQHYQDETLVHVRGSIIDSSVPFSDFYTGPTGEIVIDSTRNFPAFDTIIDDDNFLLVEEIQSDLLTKGYVKPKSPFDAAFSEAIEEYNFENPVKYQEAYGDISTDIQKIFKELDEEGIYSPELPIQLEPLNSNPFFSPETETAFTNKISDKGYITFEELRDYIKSQNTNSESIWGILSRLQDKVPDVSVVNDAPGGKTYTNISLDLDDPTFDNLLDTFYKSVKGSEIDHDILMYKYEDFIDDYNEVLLKKIKEKGLSKELDLNDLQRLREKYEESGAKGTLSVGLPPIRKNKQAVDEALKVLIAKAAQQGVDKIVIPPAERIAMARGRELKKDKGDRFYRTYVTDLNKSLKELEDNYPVIVYRDVELPYLSKTDVEDGDPFGMMNEPNFTEIDEDGVTLEEIAEIIEPLGDELLPPSKRTKLVKTGNKGTILDISELIDKYKIEQPRQFAKGGVAMNEQMEMAFMQKGGLKDDGMRQDPVSGNEVPSGSMASEVRDDIPAQLSEGEYVVPADVVRFFGVKFFEDLRMEAKMGLQSMEANGRIGGEPVAAPQEGTLSDEEFAMLLQKELQMAEGGMVPEMDQTMGTPAPIKAAEGTLVPTKRFNPFRYAGLGSTLTPGYLPPAPPTEELPTVETEESCAARGMVLGPNGVCIMPIAEQVTTRGTDDDPAVPVETAEAKPWYEDDSTLFTDPSSYIEAQLGRGEMFDNPLMRAGALMAGPLGLVAGAASKIGDIEGIARSRAALEVARATGSLPAEEIERLQKLIDRDVQGNLLVDQDGKGFGIATGQNYLNDFAKSLGFANWSQATKSENKEKLVGFQKSRETGFTSKKLQSMTPEERKAMIDKANEDAKKKREAAAAAKTSGGGSSGRDDGPSAASMMKERLDKQAKKEGQTGGFSGSVTGGAVYAGGNRAEGGLMLKKKKPKKKK